MEKRIGSNKLKHNMLYHSNDDFRYLSLIGHDMTYLKRCNFVKSCSQKGTLYSNENSTSGFCPINHACTLFTPYEGR